MRSTCEDLLAGLLADLKELQRTPLCARGAKNCVVHAKR